MNPDLLIAHFNRISNAPDAIPRLRSFILDLAIRGKLAEQDSSDEPATTLLDRIRAEKARLIKAGELRNQDLQPPIDAASIPFSIARNWRWTRLGDVIHLISGQHLQPGEYSEQKEGGLPYITGPADFGPNGLVITRHALVKKAIARKGQVLLTVKGAGVGKTTICDLPEVAISRQLMAILAIGWSQQFLLLTTHRLAAALIKSARSLIPGISREDVNQFIFPLPPLAEQQRIIAKVDELMALCDRLEAAQRERDSRRDRLTAASHHHLNNGADTDTIRNYAYFFIGHLPHLTARPDQIKQLRQTILNQAIRGRLVPQLSKDQPSSELISEIEKEKARLQGEGKIRTLDLSVPLLGDESPFVVPSSWKWVSLGKVLLSSFYGPRFGAHEYSQTGIPTIRTTDMTADGRIVLRDPPKVKVPDDRLLDFACQRGDLLITRTGSIGTMAVFDDHYSAIPSAYLIRLRFTPRVYVRYIHLSMRSTYGQESLGLGTTKVAQPNINAKSLAAITIPLPPLAEQHRIVAKVDELMALCDQLEARLTSAQAESEQLLESVLYHALNDEHHAVGKLEAIQA